VKEIRVYQYKYECTIDQELANATASLPGGAVCSLTRRQHFSA